MDYKPKRKKFLNASEIEDVVEEIAILAKQERVQIALLGGAAMQLYGSDRLTTDVDFVGGDVLPLRDVSALTFGGVRGLASNGVPVDIIVRDDSYSALYEEALNFAQRVEGIDVPVVRPEYLAAMKLAAGRPKDDSDLEALVTSGELDLVTARQVIRRHLGQFALEAFESVVYEMEWRLSREKK